MDLAFCSMIATHSYATHSYVVNVLPSQDAKCDFESFNAFFRVFYLCQVYFRFDHAYWSVDAKDPGFAGQDVVSVDAETKVIFERILEHIEVFLSEILICVQFCLKSPEIDWVARFFHD